MLTAILLLIPAATYLAANTLVWSGQNRDSFAKICADSHRDPLLWVVAATFAAAIVAANVYL